MPSRHRSSPFPVVLLAVILGSGCYQDPVPPAVPGPTTALPPPPPASPSAPASSASDEEAFGRLATGFLARYLELSPVDATRIGDHEHDASWPDWSEAGEAVERQFIQETRSGLKGLRRDTLSPQSRVDAAILENRLAYWEFTLDQLRYAVVNPRAWTELLGDGLDPLLTRDFAPLADRLKSLQGRLQGIPAVVAAAKVRLANPPRVHTETAIEQNKGLIALCRKGLAEHLAKTTPAQRAEVESAAKVAQQALEGFQTFLEKDLLLRSGGDFRLGAKLFRQKLRFTLDDEVDPDALVKAARALLAETQEQMVSTALEIWPSLFGKAPKPQPATTDEKRALVKKVLDRLADDHPTNATIVGDARRTLEEATAFVREKNLVRLPEEPCRIIEMPEYRRGVAVAYCDSSGPLEKKQETFYAIAPTPRDWPPKRAESFYREYNRSMLADLTVHEAMPGHYLQAMHANRFKSTIRAVFSNGAFVEGWAVYAESVLAKHGFGGPRVRIMREKMVLRLACNAILDHDVHAGTMDEKEALALMTKEGFQEEGEAVGKWKRARLTSAQLSTYFYGFTEMTKLRAAAEKREGFTERAYHDRLLSFGEPSFKHLRVLMAAPKTVE